MLILYRSISAKCQADQILQYPILYANMSDYYKSKRIRNLYSSESAKPFRLSRSKIDLFLECKRCFYLDRKLGIARPPGYPFSLNSAVDALLKKEFDMHRAHKTIHPLVKDFGIDLIPFQHESIDAWRDSLRRGITYEVPETNVIVTGGVDDVWVNPKTGELTIVDYKATSKNGEVRILDADWQIGYKRQMEVYQWLFRKNGFKVSNTGYFVYCNGKADSDAFNAKLEFDIKLLPYEGNDSWVDNIVHEAYETLCDETVPISDSNCDFCNYFIERGKVD